MRALVQNFLSEIDANQAWFMELFCEANAQYVAAWEFIQTDRFYEAWKLLERVEIACATLHRNRNVALSGLDYDGLASQVAEWQKIFPYKVFLSPEMVIGSHECSICGLSSDPWSGCKHRKGRVYMGKQCIHIARNVHFVGISLVFDPVQKYSVAFANGKDHFSYDVVKFARDRLRTARSRWTCKREVAYHPHERFADFPPDGDCPCESGAPYKKCCLDRPGVVRPHVQFVFEEPPPVHLPMALLPDRLGNVQAARLA